MMAQESQNSSEPAHWVWVASSEYYAEENGSDRNSLDPSMQSDSGGWWTCHKNTIRGDLILLYRKKPKMDFGYLIQAESDAYSLSDDYYAVEQGWEYGCDYKVLYKFSNPLTLSDLRSDPYMEEWGAFRGNFQGKVFTIAPDMWHRLVKRIASLERGFAAYLSKGAIQNANRTVFREEELEDCLSKDLSALKRFGYDLELRERQLICSGHGGRIDLLCYDRKAKRYVVVELKNVRAGQNTFAQVSTYMGWVERDVSKGKRVHGLVIARGCDNRFLTAAATNKRVEFVDLRDIGFAE
jgi:hypothetical protein